MSIQRQRLRCGIIGYFMKKLDFPIAPAVLGLVLGDRAELSPRRALLLSLGDPLILVSRPISAILLAAAAFSIIYPIFKKSKMFRES
jgi:putative tricarboxylic transport membrane protein